MALKIVQSKLSRDTHLQDKVGLSYLHTVPDSETERPQKLTQYNENMNKSSVALQVLHLLRMEQSSPAPKQKLFRK